MYTLAAHQEFIQTATSTCAVIAVAGVAIVTAATVLALRSSGVVVTGDARRLVGVTLAVTVTLTHCRHKALY